MKPGKVLGKESDITTSAASAPYSLPGMSGGRSISQGKENTMNTKGLDAPDSGFDCAGCPGDECCGDCVTKNGCSCPVPEKDHSPYCPVSIAFGKGRLSTLCQCANIEAANKSAEECLRCHQLAVDCKCGTKAQLV